MEKPFSDRLRTHMSRFVPPLNEQIASGLYDYQNIAAVPERMDFFVKPVGYPGENGGPCRTRMDTSMWIAGCLPAGNSFFCSGVRVVFIPDYPRHRHRMRKDRQDAARVLLGGELRLMIGNREFLSQAPLARFPACLPKLWQAELAYLSAEDEEPHWRMLYDPALPRIAGMAYYAIVPLYIKANQYFRVEIQHTPAELNAPGRLGVILDGRLLREAS